MKTHTKRNTIREIIRKIHTKSFSSLIFQHSHCGSLKKNRTPTVSSQRLEPSHCARGHLHAPGDGSPKQHHCVQGTIPRAKGPRGHWLAMEHDGEKARGDELLWKPTRSPNQELH